MAIENAIVIVNKTRLQQLVERFNTKAQAKFYIEHQGGNFDDYQREHDQFMRSLDEVQRIVGRRLRNKVVERRFLPNFLFSDKDVAVVVGQDGLVANTAKYVGGLPIVAVNPDVARFDGVLLPFTPRTLESGLVRTLEGRAAIREVTMAEARLNDGQRLLAFNDFFIGPSSHISARYRITHGSESESHSSSGIIVTTGAGSTGWLSSMLNMANGISARLGVGGAPVEVNLPWDARELLYVVREPFRSKYSQASMASGWVTDQAPLQVESFMPSGGVIFSDGIEADYLAFNSGAIVHIGIAQQHARLVTR